MRCTKFEQSLPGFQVSVDFASRMRDKRLCCSAGCAMLRQQFEGMRTSCHTHACHGCERCANLAHACCCNLHERARTPRTQLQELCNTHKLFAGEAASGDRWREQAVAAAGQAGVAEVPPAVHKPAAHDPHRGCGALLRSLRHPDAQGHQQRYPRCRAALHDLPTCHHAVPQQPRGERRREAAQQHAAAGALRMCFMCAAVLDAQHSALQCAAQQFGNPLLAPCHMRRWLYAAQLACTDSMHTCNLPARRAARALCHLSHAPAPTRLPSRRLQTSSAMARSAASRRTSS